MNTKRLPRCLTSVVFLAIPVLLYWYSAANCEELACVGPGINGFLHALVVIPLLILWWRRHRALYPAMLSFAEAGMIWASTWPSFDFSPQFTIIVLPAGLLVGAGAGLAIERGTPRD